MDVITLHEDSLPELYAAMTIKTCTAHHHVGVLHRIFEFSLPTSLPSPTDRNTVSKFFATTPPYNIASVCRSWRDLVVSSPSLWSKFFFSLSDPEDRTLKTTKHLIELHLQRSRNAPLTCFVNLTGTYETSLSQEIVTLLSKHQGRWRRVSLHFYADGMREYTVDADGRSVPYIRCAIPVPKTHLIVEDLGLLEEFRVTFSPKYITPIPSSPQTIHPSLTRLELQVPPGYNDRVLSWLMLSPNVQELDVVNCPKYSCISSSAHSSRNEKDIHTMRLANLRSMRAGSYDLGANYPGSALAATVLAHTTCPSLIELDLHLNSVGFDDVLFNFFHRSAPRLEILHLDVNSRLLSGFDRSEWEMQPGRIFDALALVPTLREFSVEWSETNQDAIGVLFLALARTCIAGDRSSPFVLLPTLERLELIDSYASSSQYVDLIASRWCSPLRTLNAVKLSYCSVALPYSSWKFKSLPAFKPGDDLERLPDELKVIKTFVNEGLRLEIQSLSL